MRNDSFYISLQGESVKVDVVSASDSEAVLRVNGNTINIAGSLVPGDNIQHLVVDGTKRAIGMCVENHGTVLTHQGHEVQTNTLTKLEHDLYELMPEKEEVDTSSIVLSPMPGKVLSVFVEAGQRIKVGEKLCIIEAMKMENVLCAEIDGEIDEVLIEANQTVDTDQTLVTFKV